MKKLSEAPYIDGKQNLKFVPFLNTVAYREAR